MAQNCFGQFSDVRRDEREPAWAFHNGARMILNVFLALMALVSFVFILIRFGVIPR